MTPPRLKGREALLVEGPFVKGSDQPGVIPILYCSWEGRTCAESPRGHLLGMGSTPLLLSGLRHHLPPVPSGFLCGQTGSLYLEAAGRAALQGCLCSGCASPRPWGGAGGPGTEPQQWGA